MRHRKYTYNYDTPAFNRVKALNCAVLSLFFRNNSYKLKKANKTLYRQIKDLNANGITIDYGNIHKLKSGKEFFSSLSYLSFFCDYWGCTLLDMISYDMEEYEARLSSAG